MPRTERNPVAGVPHLKHGATSSVGSTFFERVYFLQAGDDSGFVSLLLLTHLEVVRKSRLVVENPSIPVHDAMSHKPIHNEPHVTIAPTGRTNFGRNSCNKYIVLWHVTNYWNTRKTQWETFIYLPIDKTTYLLEITSIFLQILSRPVIQWGLPSWLNALTDYPCGSIIPTLLFRQLLLLFEPFYEDCVTLWSASSKAPHPACTMENSTCLLWT